MSIYQNQRLKSSVLEVNSLVRHHLRICPKTTPCLLDVVGQCISVADRHRVGELLPKVVFKGQSDFSNTIDAGLI